MHETTMIARTMHETTHDDNQNTPTDPMGPQRSTKRAIRHAKAQLIVDRSRSSALQSMASCVGCVGCPSL